MPKKLLDEIKIKYPDIKFNYPPNQNCKFCNGTGEHKKSKKEPDKKTFCICLFVNHKHSDKLGILLGEFSKRELKNFI